MMATKQGGGSVDMDKLVETEINYFKLLKKEKEYLFRLGNSLTHSLSHSLTHSLTHSFR